jgi:tetratricopeptide (TPR) repeat protein
MDIGQIQQPKKPGNNNIDYKKYGWIKGVLLFDVGNYSQAIHYFDKALAIDPHNVKALTSKGRTLLSK